MVAVGPGVGRTPETAAAIRRFALAVDRPLVIDADGLAPFEGSLEALAARASATVLTPHPGELARLLGVSTAAGAAATAWRRCAPRRARSGAVVVLKGDRSLVAAPDGEVWINDTGGPELATGGSGDVLTGLLAARLAQGDEPAVAAALAVHLHGLAGDLGAAGAGGPALPAGDLVLAISAAYQRLSSP